VDRDEILRVLREFEAAGLDYVLIGATAMGVHGLIRATEDIDLFVKPNPDNIERLRTALTAAYDGDPNIRDISTDDLLGEYPAVRYYPPSGDLYFDILTRLGDTVTQGSAGRGGTAQALSPQGGIVTSSSRRVQKSRSIEEMNAADSIDIREGDFERFLRHCARYWQLAPRLYPRGVFRFRSIEEAEAARSQHRHPSEPADR
jgi:hypothetical protein